MKVNESEVCSQNKMLLLWNQLLDGLSLFVVEGDCQLVLISDIPIVLYLREPLALGKNVRFLVHAHRSSQINLSKPPARILSVLDIFKAKFANNIHSKGNAL